jgi:hypothetical protein
MTKLVNMNPIAIDLDIGNTLEAINAILARRDSERATVWDSLSCRLEAVSFAVGDLDRMYFAVLAEIENIFAEPKPAPERIDAAIAQATIYCTDGRLALRLDEWRGVIEAAAFNHALKHRRYRTLASVLRSLNDPLNRYIQRLYHLQGGSSANDLMHPVQASGAPESFLEYRRWNLRTVLDLLKEVAFQRLEDESAERGADLREASEQAIRNYDRAISHSGAAPHPNSRAGAWLRWWVGGGARPDLRKGAPAAGRRCIMCPFMYRLCG